MRYPSHIQFIMTTGDEAMLLRGTHLVRQNSTNSTLLSNRHFISFFGVPPKTAFRIWQRINSQNSEEYNQDHLLISLDFLFNYNTQSRACLQFNISEPTYRNIIWDGVYKLRRMKLVCIFLDSNQFNYPDIFLPHINLVDTDFVLEKISRIRSKKNSHIS